MSLSERGIARTWDVTHQEPGGPHVRQGFVLGPGHFEEFDPFLMMAEDWFRRGTFEDHPHRGIETVTVVLEGHLEHRDNHGGRGILGPGDVQWMTAGRGVVHAEEPVEGETVHSLQLWVNLPRALKGAPPRYQDLKDVPVRREDGAEVRVFSGTSGKAVSGTLNHVPVTAVEFRLTAGSALMQELPPGVNGFVYVVEGSGVFGREAVAGQAGRVLWLERSDGDDPTRLAVGSDEGLRAFLFAGPPIKEPVVAYGPFVMNSMEEIREAFADYRAGRF